MNPTTDQDTTPVLRRVTVREIVTAVAAASHVPEDEIMSDRKFRHLVVPRWAIMRIASKDGRSLHQIGRAMDLHHTTVLHGLQTTERLGTRYPDRAGWLSEIESKAIKWLARKGVYRPIGDAAPYDESAT